MTLIPIVPTVPTIKWSVPRHVPNSPYKNTYGSNLRLILFQSHTAMPKRDWIQAGVWRVEDQSRSRATPSVACWLSKCVFVPGYVSEPGSVRGKRTDHPPSALTSAQGQRCNLLNRCQCIRSWRCTQRTASPEDRSSSRAAHGFFGKCANEPRGRLADVLHVACQRVQCFTFWAQICFIPVSDK